ncbi:UPF0489 family protein [Bradyrhizobium sp. Pa8]|uniref:UPF0489 family protein n=1 Tax=Bradyrhizobium sp. Pa8 TaxID=3386552 RepID=UPI00403F8401
MAPSNLRYVDEASEGEWLVPFRGPSGAFTQNFLWKRQNVYVMDNHRAALWCWLQHINPKQPYSLFHMDQHYDTLASRMTTWLDNLPPDWGLRIDEYLARKVKHQDIPQPLPLFGWDNYLSIFLAVFESAMDTAYFATHGKGTTPKCTHMNCDLWHVPSNLDYWLLLLARRRRRTCPVHDVRGIHIEYDEDSRRSFG